MAATRTTVMAAGRLGLRVHACGHRLAMNRSTPRRFFAGVSERGMPNITPDHPGLNPEYAETGRFSPERLELSEEERAQRRKDFTIHKKWHKKVEDLSFLGDKYGTTKAHPEPRRAKVERVPPPPASMSDLTRTKFRVPKTQSEANDPYMWSSPREENLVSQRRAWKKKMTASRRVWLAELSAAKQANDELYAKERADIAVAKAELAEVKAQKSLIRQKEAKEETEKVMAEAAKRRAVREERGRQLRAKAKDARKYQLHYLLKERGNWFENLDDITEEIFSPRKEVAPTGFWPDHVVAAQPRLGQNKASGEKLQEAMEERWRTRNHRMEA